MKPFHQIVFDRRVRLEGRDDDGIAFVMLSPFGAGVLRVIATSGCGWDHVSVSLVDRTPTWEEMSVVRDLCFEPEECCMELHVPRSEHINHHPYCLHLWRPLDAEIPQPPGWMVALKKTSEKVSGGS
jgi:hypothetical protein